MLREILNKSWRQHPTRHQLYDHLPPVTKTIQVRRTIHAGHCWRSKDELISDVLLWTPAYGQAKAGRSARTYTQQLCEDTGCSPEHLPEAMNDREKWREWVKDIRANGTTWWWWWWWINPSSNSNNRNDKKSYMGSMQGTFKQRYYNHKSSFALEIHRHKTNLSNYVWKVKNKFGIDLELKWEIVKRCSKYKGW